MNYKHFMLFKHGLSDNVLHILCFKLTTIIYLYFKVVPMYEGRHSILMNLLWWYKPEDTDTDYVL